jgi:predicted aconitase with swiveling domain
MGGLKAMITLKGRKVSPGKAKGEALVTNEPIGFNFGVDPQTGVVVERGHQLEGVSIKDKILVFPSGKGSTGGSFSIYQIGVLGTAPKAMINIRSETIVAVGAVMAHIPLVDRLDSNPIEIIENGDEVEVDADNGLVIINK